MALEVVQATGAILEDILDRTHPVWGEGLDRTAYGRYNAAQLNTPWGEGHLARLALVNGRRWLSTAKRYRLRIRLRGREVDAVGIGAVFTPQELRRRGCAAELIRHIVDAARAEGAGLAILFSEIGTRYYEQFGFRSVPIHQLVLDVRGHSSFAPRAVEMRPGETADLPAISEMNALQADGLPLHVVRSTDYVAFAMAKKRSLAANSPPGSRAVEFFVAEEGGRPSAYIVVLESGGYWMVTECGDRDPSGARVGAMLQAMTARSGNPPLRVRAWLPPNFVPKPLGILWRERPGVVMMTAHLGNFDPGTPLSSNEVGWWHSDAF